MIVAGDTGDIFQRVKKKVFGCVGICWIGSNCTAAERVEMSFEKAEDVAFFFG